MQDNDVLSVGGPDLSLPGPPASMPSRTLRFLANTHVPCPCRKPVVTPWPDGVVARAPGGHRARWSAAPMPRRARTFSLASAVPLGHDRHGPTGHYGKHANGSGSTRARAPEAHNGNRKHEGGRLVRSAQESRVICVGNQKGGVGKTTTCVQLAAAFAERGALCLIIDLDMTAGATKLLRAPTQGWNDSFDLITGTESAFDVVIDNDDPEVKLPKNLHLVPGSTRLRDLEQYLFTHEWIVHQDMLLAPLTQLRERYDFIFLDTPPQSTKTTVPALKAADFVILSTMPDRLAIEALHDALRQIQTAKAGPHPDLTLLGVLVHAIPSPKTRLARGLLQALSSLPDIAPGIPLKFVTDVVRTVVVQEAMQAGKTIFEYAPDHNAAQQYRALADEVRQRITKLVSDTTNATAAVSANA